MNKERVKQLVKEILIEIGEDPNREGLRDTPRRVADLYEEVFQGYDRPLELGVSFSQDSEYVVQRDIPFYSFCEHHLLPFYGKVHIAYEPNGRVIGLSKLARLVNKYARRLQLQERMTNQIADELDSVGVKGLVVIVEAEHFCLKMRGPKSDGQTITSAFRGSLREGDRRKEVLSLMKENGAFQLESRLTVASS